MTARTIPISDPADLDIERCTTIAAMADALDQAATVVQAGYNALRAAAGAYGLPVEDPADFIAGVRQLAQTARDSIA